jgi:hypothetical protein
MSTDSLWRFNLSDPIAGLYKLAHSRPSPDYRLGRTLQLVEGVLRFLALVNLADAAPRLHPGPIGGDRLCLRGGSESQAEVSPRAVGRDVAAGFTPAAAVADGAEPMQVRGPTDP